MKNSLPSQQIEQSLKRLRQRFDLRRKSGAEIGNFWNDFEAFLKQELEAVAESARKEILIKLRAAMDEEDASEIIYRVEMLIDVLSKPKECECHCHCSPQPCPTTRLEKSYCKHCKPKGEDK